MKRWIIGILLVVVVISVVVIVIGGSTKYTERIIGESQIHAEEEINAAMDVVEKEFKTFGWRGCELQTLEYDESLNDSDEKNLVLNSSFYVRLNGASDQWEPDYTYSNWYWNLTLNENGKWELQTWGEV